MSDQDPRSAAIIEGKLPPSQVRGASPHGEPVIPGAPSPRRYKVCQCRSCSPTRRMHWYCCICGGGAYLYASRVPFFTKNWYEPGGIRGLAHHCCSEPCRVDYLRQIGVQPGVNDHEPVDAGDSAADRRVVSPDSDL